MVTTSAGQKMRLDQAMVERGLVETRSKARALILAGEILVNGRAEAHAGAIVRVNDELVIRAKPRFVSRGGEKLDHALASFDIAVDGMICADLGASTGGFSDCLLKRGARMVYAVDVGYGQLDASLRHDPRIIVMERTNARYLETLPEPVDIVVIDVSFISLSLILPVAATVLRPGGRCVPLIKPQFEAGRKDVGKGGVVRDAAVHERVIRDVIGYAAASGFSCAGLVRSPLAGPAGNIEFLANLLAVGNCTDSPALDAWIAEALDPA